MSKSLARALDELLKEEKPEVVAEAWSLATEIIDLLDEAKKLEERIAYLEEENLRLMMEVTRND